MDLGLKERTPSSRVPVRASVKPLPSPWLQKDVMWRLVPVTRGASTLQWLK